MRRLAVELDDRAIAFLANEADMRQRDDVAAMDAHEGCRRQLRLGFRDRPGTHAVATAVVNQRVMGIGADAAHIDSIDEMRAIGAFDRDLRHGRPHGLFTLGRQR